jgi:uncharacterized membrane protein YqjE
VPTRDGRPGVGAATKLVADKVSTIVRLELALAAAELKKKAASFGVGIGLFAGAALFAVFALGFLFAAIAAGIATALPTWAALLIVFALLVVLTALLVFFGRRSIEKATPPVPEQAIAEAKLTTEALKSNGKT